jgi:6-phosphogluconolactonase (cycloisomerase 2 family)
MFAYVGSFTTRKRNARGKGISVFEMDPRSGALALVQLVQDLVNPSYLALTRSGEFLYCIHGDEQDASAFAVDRASGKLRFLNRQSTEGTNPVHLALDSRELHLVVTNHIGASLAVLPIARDGSLQPISQLVTSLTGPIGPHRLEQQQAKPHFNPFDPSGRFVVVPDKGLDRVFSFRFENGRLVPAAMPFVATREGAGPRNLVFHPRIPCAYVVNELDSTVTAYRFDGTTGGLEPLQILPTLPSTFTGNSRAAGIALDAQGRTLYASNRGHDSIVVFRVDFETGLLHFVGTEPTQGRTPRFFSLSPDGRLLYALNEDSDTMVVFHVDASDGLIAPTGTTIDIASPACMVFSPPPAAPSEAA